jgi:hypothetical protein
MPEDQPPRNRQSVQGQRLNRPSTNDKGPVSQVRQTNRGQRPGKVRALVKFFVMFGSGRARSSDDATDRRCTDFVTALDCLPGVPKNILHCVPLCCQFSIGTDALEALMSCLFKNKVAP